MRRSRARNTWGVFPLAGWLFTDLLLALMVVFLASAANGVPVNVGMKAIATTTPTAPAIICGMDRTYQKVTVTSSDPYGVRAQTPGALDSFYQDVQQSNLKSGAGRIAGFVEVFGGSADVGDGITFAAGAIQALRKHANGTFLFSSQTAFFQPLWDGSLASNQISIYVFYFVVAQSCT